MILKCSARPLESNDLGCGTLAYRYHKRRAFKMYVSYTIHTFRKGSFEFVETPFLL